MYVEKLFNLKGKVVGIIGGGGYLCSEMAKSFAKAGCFVIIIDIREEKAKKVVNEINKLGFKNTVSLSLDVGEKEEHKFVLNSILDKFGKLDVIINGAGIMDPHPIWRSLIKVEFYHGFSNKRNFSRCQVYGAHMLEQGAGNIINISSASAGPPLSRAFTYSAAKAAIKLNAEWLGSGLQRLE